MSGRSRYNKKLFNYVDPSSTDREFKAVYVILNKISSDLEEISASIVEIKARLDTLENP